MIRKVHGHLREFWNKSQNDLIFTQATALAYTSLLSLVPLLAMAFFLFKSFGGFEKLLEQMQPMIDSNLAPAFSDKISGYLDEVIHKVHAGAVGGFGLLGFVFTTITTISTIEKSFNFIWGVKKSRSLARRIPTYWTMATVGPVLIATSMMIGSKATLWLRNDQGVLSQGLVRVFDILPYFSSGLFFAMLFFFIPNVKMNIKDALGAGVVTGVVFELAKSIYAVYARNMITKDAVYGTLVVIPVFLIWLYVIWLIVLFGAEFCCYLQYRRLGIRYNFNWEVRLTSFAVADIIEELASRSKNKRAGLTAEELQAKLQMPFHELSAHLEFLENESWIISSKNRYVLAIPSEQVDMSAISAHLDRHRYVPKSRVGLKVQEKMKTLWKNPIT